MLRFPCSCCGALLTGQLDQADDPDLVCDVCGKGTMVPRIPCVREYCLGVYQTCGGGIGLGADRNTHDVNADWCSPDRHRSFTELGTSSYVALMGQNASALGIAIGRRVTQERQAHRTLDHLAEAAGVSRRMLVNVEQGVANPSVGTLLRISDALGAGLPSLVEPPRSMPMNVTLSGAGATLWTGEHGGRGERHPGRNAEDPLAREGPVRVRRKGGDECRTSVIFVTTR